MKAITFDHTGGPEVLKIHEVPQPKPGPDQLLVNVKAAGINRADILQRLGKHGPPPGDSSILGLEIAGEIVALGSNVKDFTIGQKVFGLVGGGGYAEYCVIDSGCAMFIPEDFTFAEAAAIPEAFLTAYEGLFTLGNLRPSESVLIHAGASGVGSAAIQLAHHKHAKIYTTVGSPEKKAQVLTLGADVAIEYKTVDFVIDILKRTDQQGVNLIIDFVGGNYLMRNLQILKTQGRLICIGLLGGKKTDIHLDCILTKRLQIKGLSMRSQTLAEKRLITKNFCEQFLPALESRTIFPVIDSVFPLAQACKAHQRIEANANIGKIILTTDDRS